MTDSGSRRRSRRPGHARPIDRSTVKPALLVLAFAILTSVVLPWANSRAPYRHAIHRGDIAELANEITLPAAPGWDLASGALVGHARTPVGSTASTELVVGGIDLLVRVAPFAGTPHALLARVKAISSKFHHARGASARTASYRVKTRQGAVGVGEDFSGVTKQGSVIVFVFVSRRLAAREGVEVLVSGPQDAMLRRRREIVAMINGIRIAS
jgi:hypothetical protein